jgi:hypothetical protein
MENLNIIIIITSDRIVANGHGDRQKLRAKYSLKDIIAWEIGNTNNT